MTRIYVAGPMAGIEAMNYPAFNAAAAQLRELGYEVENPAENPEPPCKSWRGYMRLSVVQIAKVDALVMLPGWTKSRGANVEHALALGLGLEVWTLDQVLKLPR